MGTCSTDYPRVLCETWEPTDWWESRKYKSQKNKTKNRNVVCRGEIICSNDDISVMAVGRIQGVEKWLSFGGKREP